MRKIAVFAGFSLVLFLAAACPSTALYPPPVTLVEADLMPGVSREPAAGSATVDSGEQISETVWGTLVFRIRLRNDGETTLKNIETRLIAPDVVKDLYGGADPFAAAGGKRINYGKLSFDLEPGATLEVKRSINVVSLSSDSDANFETLLPNEIAHLIEVNGVADRSVFEIRFEGGGQVFDLSGLLERKDWPPFTMVYVLEQGQAVAVGGRDDRPVQPRQVRRLEYKSATEWVDSVVESAPIETRVGTFNAVGSYRQLDGQKLVEFDSVTNSFDESEIEEGVRHLPLAFILPYRNREFEEADGIIPTKVETDALVCFQNDCEDNAAGLLYLLDNGQERVFVDDSRGFPLRVGALFAVRELRVDDERR